MGGVLSWIQQLFWSQEMEIVILGLQNAGKSSYVHVIQNGDFKDNMIPTVGFNMKKVTKGRVTIKVWDMGGQKQFRGMWERYSRDVQCIVFIVDIAEPRGFEAANQELWKLVNHPAVANIPLLVLLNKNDLPEAVAPEQAVAALELQKIKNREVAYYPISCKNISNIDKSLEWLTARSKSASKK